MVPANKKQIKYCEITCGKRVAEEAERDDDVRVMQVRTVYGLWTAMMTEKKKSKTIRSLCRCHWSIYIDSTSPSFLFLHDVWMLQWTDYSLCLVAQTIFSVGDWAEIICRRSPHYYRELSCKPALRDTIHRCIFDHIRGRGPFCSEWDSIDFIMIFLCWYFFFLLLFISISCCVSLETIQTKWCQPFGRPSKNEDCCIFFDVRPMDGIRFDWS